MLAPLTGQPPEKITCFHSWVGKFSGCVWHVQRSSPPLASHGVFVAGDHLLEFPLAGHRAHLIAHLGRQLQEKAKKKKKTFRKFAASGAMQLSIFPASRFSADGKTLPSYLPFPDHGLPFLHTSSPNSPSCGFILSFPVSLIYKILPYKLCNRPLEFTKNKNKKLNSWPNPPKKKNEPKRLRTDTLAVGIKN